MRMGEPDVGDYGTDPSWSRWSTRSVTPQHPPSHQLARHSRSQQDNRHPFEAEDARPSTGSLRSKPGAYYSPPGTSYTIIERPASSHGHHTSYSQQSYQAKLSRGGYSANYVNSRTSREVAVNGSKKGPISPEQVLRLFGQGGASALTGGKERPRRHSPASSPSSTTHHATTYRPEPRPYSSSAVHGPTGSLPPINSMGTPMGPSSEQTTRTVTMTRDPPEGSHGFGICVKGGKEAGVGVYISRVEEGSVAERSGLRPGDSILQVNGTPFSGITHEDALKMLKSCRQLSMIVRTGGAVVPKQTCSWMDRQGRPVSPPPPASILPPPGSTRHGIPPSRSGSKDRSIRRVDLCIEPGQSLGLMIRGGLEYNLGIFITGVDKDSVADRAGLMVGDQILEVNGQSFVEVTHDEAVAQLKYHKRMSLLVRDVGKVPHACTAYGDRADPASPKNSWGRRRGAAATAVEQKAKSIVAASDLPSLAYYMEEYANRRMPAENFLAVLKDILDTPAKLTLLTELREFMLPEDRPRFDELVYRREFLPHSEHHGDISSKETEGVRGYNDYHRSPSEDSGLGLPPHDYYRATNRSRSSGGFSRDNRKTPRRCEEPNGFGHYRLQEYEEEERRSRRHSSPCNSREGSTNNLHAQQRFNDHSGYLEGLRSSLGGWTQKVKSWYWGRPLELAHKLSRSFDMKEDGSNLLQDGTSGIRRHQSMQRLGHTESMLDENRAAKVIPDHHGNLHITVKKSKPILGIAIEGGANTKHPLPRIINIHEDGAAHDAGGLEVGQLILAVDGKRVDGMQHQEVARLIAESFAQRDKPEIEFLVVEAKKSNLEPKPTALIFLEA